MTLMVSSFHRVKVAEANDRIAHVTPDGTLWLYPQGEGIGPAISMSAQDWMLICDQANAALRKWVDQRLGVD